VDYRLPVLPPVIAVLFFFSTTLGALSPGQSPDEEQWLAFIKSNPGRPGIPEDAEMGLLADRHNPDPLWASALEVCDSAFDSIRKGIVPREELSPYVRVPLSLDFSRVLSQGGKDLTPRYALPQRDGESLSIQVRLISGDIESTGFIFLGRVDGEWFIDQWMLDLSIYPDNGVIPAESEEGEENPGNEG